MTERMGSSEVRVEGLSGAQETALAALRAGGTFVKAAEEAGVNRVTVYRWVRDDPHFQAAYNAWQQEAAESARARLVKLADMAVDVVEKALRRDDEKVALKVLRGVGALRKGRKASTSPEVLDLTIQLRKKRELRQAEMGMLHHLMKKMGMPARERKRMIAGGRGTSEFLEGVQKELERRGAASQDETSEHNSTNGQEMQAPRQGTEIRREEGNVTSPEREADPMDGARDASGSDNPFMEHEMQPTAGAQEEGAGDVTSDVTSNRVLHESVA